MRERLAEILTPYRGQRGAVIPALQKVQEALGYLPEPAITEIANFLGVSQNEVYGVASFYLGGAGNIDEVLAPAREEITPFDLEKVEGEKYRPPLPMLPLRQRLQGNATVVLGWDTDQKPIAECQRCLRCDLEER